jgi:hypothetical protein
MKTCGEFSYNARRTEGVSAVHQDSSDEYNARRTEGVSAAHQESSDESCKCFFNYSSADWIKVDARRVCLRAYDETGNVIETRCRRLKRRFSFEAFTV